MAAKLKPVQVIANSLQVERIPGTRENPFVNLDGQILRGFARDAIQMLEAYGYSIMSRDDARTMACGLLHDGINADKLTPKAHDEIRAAIDAILKTVKSEG